MGLSLVKQIVDEHLGDISAESVTGTGATFMLRFPLRWKQRLALQTCPTVPPETGIVKLIDLSHVFDDAMPVYPGDPTPELRQSPKTGSAGYAIGTVRTVLHAGTHIDGPLHVIEGGSPLSDIPVGRFAGRGVLIDARGRASVDTGILSDKKLQRGDIVLVMSGHSTLYHAAEYFLKSPVITEPFAQALVDAGVSMLGIDFASPDSPPFPVHHLLLSRGILIIENLTNLDQLAGVSRFEVFALPVRFRAEAGLARVIARLP
jgi:kynurenine formamidase